MDNKVVASDIVIDAVDVGSVDETFDVVMEDVGKSVDVAKIVVSSDVVIDDVDMANVVVSSDVVMNDV